jgi:hypothetical protein
MTKAVGFILTITGLLLLVSFLQVAQQPGPAPLPYFIDFAIAVMMLSVGMRYILRGFATKTPQHEPTPQQDSLS